MTATPSTLIIDKQGYNQDALAADRSVFVAANAGSGKTTLLVARVLALLMQGVLPSKILCLTFTNAAASEMQGRVVRTLGRWVMLSDSALDHELLKLLPPPITERQRRTARSLFAQVLDAPVPLRLQTIHGFCQSLLARFPLEAGVPLTQRVMDDVTQKTLLREARMQLFAHAEGDERNLLSMLVTDLGEHSLMGLLSSIITHKRRFSALLAAHHGLALAVKYTYRPFGVDEMSDAPSYAMGEESLASLRAIVAALAQSEKSSDAARVEAMSRFITEGDFEHYAACFLNKDGSPTKSLHTKDAVSTEQSEFLRAEQARVVAFVQQRQNWHDAELTANVLRVAERLLAHYTRLKEQRGLMDFDDQILAATRLLSADRASAWVMYKLDGGIDHVLVDEAQDTSPEQWQIVRAITQEFYAGLGKSSDVRSMFVVGDEKQSIFRFQGADPAGLAENRHYFGERLSEAGLRFIHVSLEHSYRSAPEILSLVDQVFAPESARVGLSAAGDAPTHEAKRHDAKGYCELWPLADADEARHKSAEAVLAERIAQAIAGYVAQGASPGDVMVLVRRRTHFPAMLARALKRAGIPVAGVDRMNLLDHLVVQDLLAFAQVLLLPEDDLTLAALLKSPLFGMSEETLFALAHDRKSSLWSALSGHSAGDLLNEFRSKVDFISPYALFSELLDVRGMRRHFTGRMGQEVHEVIDLFLEQTLTYERENVTSMQGFVHWMRQADSEIKRDMEHASGEVRIMTVHAAKGLQARIVLVADTTSLPLCNDLLLWHENAGEMLPVASKAKSPGPVAHAAREREWQLEMEQYRRLLYVALTRAEDMLVVCGAAQGNYKEGTPPDAWYPLVASAFAGLGHVLEDGRSVIGEMISFAAPKPKPAEMRTLPLLPAAQAEAEPVRPLSPSRLVDDTPGDSPIIDASRLQRGVAMHRLLQYIPSIAQKEAQHAAARPLAKQSAPALDDAACEVLVAELFAVLAQPDYARFFGPDSLAEVPISGLVSWRGEWVRVSGRVDRIAVTQEAVWLLDYKSQLSPPPRHQLPATYVRQMALYREVLLAIYPNRSVHAALLWTSVPRLDVLDETDFENYM